MKLKYTDEATFITETVEFTDEYYSIAKKLHEQYDSGLSNCTPIMVREDKKSLVFCVNLGDRLKDSVAWERGDNLYKVIIEKI